MTDTTAETGEVTSDKRAPTKGSFNVERARAAAAASAKVRKERAEQRRMAASSEGSSAIPDGSVGIVVPISYVEVIRVLARQAKGGDVQAARELRAWKAEHPQVDETIELEDQPAVVRQRLLRRLLAELGPDPDPDSVTDPTVSGAAGGEATPPKLGVPSGSAPEAPQAHTLPDSEGAPDDA